MNPIAIIIDNYQIHWDLIIILLVRPIGILGKKRREKV